MKRFLFAFLMLCWNIFLPVNECCSADSLKGRRAPGFVVQDLNGNRVSLNSLLSENKPRVILFFAAWSKPCLKEITKLKTLKERTGVNITLVNVDAVTKEALRNYLSKNSINFQVLLDPDAASTGERYGYYAGGKLNVPMLVLITGSGAVRFTETGYTENIDKILEDEIIALAGEVDDSPGDIAVFFTNSTNGFLESCDCPAHPYGGLVRRASYLRSERAKYNSNILLDSGDLFSPYMRSRQAETVLKLIENIGYDAVGIGDQEFSWDGFTEEMDKYNIPFISSNLSYGGANHLRKLGRDIIDLERGGVKISVLSVIAPEVFALYPGSVTERVVVSPVKYAVEGFLRKRRGIADIFVVISHSGFEADKQLARDYPELDLIIGGHSQTTLNSPYKSGKTLIVQAGGNAQNVGRLLFKYDASKKIADYSYELTPLTKDIPDDPEARAIVNDFKTKAMLKK